jgi:adenine phosphoribosyltransferase
LPREKPTLFLRRIDTTGSGRYDVTPIFADVDAFDELVADLAVACAPLLPNLVVGIDALGFIVGTAVARALHLGFVPLRKGGKLPVSVVQESFNDYSGTTKVLELRAGALGPQHHVLIVDDWIETGAQVSAAIRLVEHAGARVAGVTAIHMDSNESTKSLAQRYRIETASGGAF